MRSLKITTLINTSNSHFERFPMQKWRLFINYDGDDKNKGNEWNIFNFFKPQVHRILLKYIKIANRLIWSAKSNEVSSIIESLKMSYNLLALLCSIPIDWLHFQVTFTRIWSTQYLSMFPYKILVKKEERPFW